MKDLFSSILVIYIIISFAAFHKWYNYSQEKKLRDLVSWSAVGDYNPALRCYSYIKEPFYKVLNAQCVDAIDEKYRISGDLEEQYLKEIIAEYQLELMRLYFRGRLAMVKSKYAVDGDEYFMIKLHDFLASHYDDFAFLGHEMHGNANSLSAFAVVYNKLFYITHMYCKGSLIANPSKSQQWLDWEETSLREILDENRIPHSKEKELC